MELTRGDLVVATAQGDYGKPRPALIVQSDLFREIDSVVVLLLTSHVRSDLTLFRVNVQPTAKNGLEKPSAVMVDKAVALPRSRLGNRIGRLEEGKLVEVNASMALFLGLA
jgi:mRNA interferase MazF